MRVEVRQIVFQRCRRVSLWIDGDEQRAGTVGVFAERFHDFGNLEQGRRANVGTMSVAEEDEKRPPLHVLVTDRPAGLVLKVKGAAQPDR
jgi:hypothetical protein